MNATAPETPAERRQPRILVVDDERSMREMLSILLKREGYEVLLAENGKSAIATLEKEQVDILISDIKMPDISGVEVLRAAKRIDQDILGIMITAFASTESAVEAMRLGACDYLTKPFDLDVLRMKVRVKREIVTMGVPDLDPLDAGDYVAPAEWNALIEQPGTLLIDTRNDYEVKIGTFTGAVDPATASFRDFPAWVAAHREEIAGAERVAMFCTGGIRCEKSTALLKAAGIAEVHHLKGGILAYLEQVPSAESRWEGECFVFDERVAIGHGLAQGSHSLCRACRMPVSPADRASPLYREGIACPACHDARDEQQRAGYAERHRQVRLAEARGTTHVGATATSINDPPAI